MPASPAASPAPDLDDLVDDLPALRAALLELDVPTTVVELGRLGRADRAVAFRVLPKGRALHVFEDLEPQLQAELLDGLKADATAELLEQLDPDDRAGLLTELPVSVVRRLLSGLSPAEREMTTALLGYPPESAGRRTTPEVVALSPQDSVATALERLRREHASAETVYLLPVLGPGRLLEGVVSLRRLLVTDPGVAVGSVMAEPVSVRATDDQEGAARRVRDNGMLAVPVVDDEDRLIGLFTVDDAMRVLLAEEAEDVARSGATAPLRRPYLSTGVLQLARLRVVWLLVLIAAAGLTVSVLDGFADVLDQVVALALFVPLIIGTGGNAGAQAATTVVRATATGEVRLADLPRVVLRESTVGLLLGLAMALVAAVPAGFFAGWSIALVLALALPCVCLLATTAGSAIPLVAKRCGVDPAVVSAPFISTFVDATGLVVYFLIATAVLGL